MLYGTDPRDDRRNEDEAEDGFAYPNEYDPAHVLDDEDLTLGLSEQERLMEPLDDDDA